MERAKRAGLNSDSMIAIILLAACGILFWATFDIRVPDYGQLKPSTWPRVIICVLALLSAIYLVQSLRQAAVEPSDDEPSSLSLGILGWLNYWRNPIICFVAFLVYLLTLPVLGSLIGGVLFVFLLMGALGSWTLRNQFVHGVLAVVTVGGMWAIFTYGLGVILPTGEIFSPF
jgi:hypothetical protein